MDRQILARPCVDTVSRGTSLAVAQSLVVEQTRPSLGVLGHSGVFCFSRLCRRFLQVASSAGRCYSLFPFLVFSIVEISSVSNV